MSSYFDGDGGDSDDDHRRQYFCHQCNRQFSLFPPPSSSDDILCANCNGDSFEELQTPIPVVFNEIRSNIPPEIRALFAAAGGVTTCNISVGPGTVFVGDQPIGVTSIRNVQYADVGLNQRQIRAAARAVRLEPVPRRGVPPPASDPESETIEEDLDLD